MLNQLDANIPIETDRHREDREREADRQTDIETDRQTDRQTDNIKSASYRQSIGIS